MVERIGGTENGGERMRGGGWKKVFRVVPYVLRHRYKYSVSILDRFVLVILTARVRVGGR